MIATTRQTKKTIIGELRNEVAGNASEVCHLLGWTFEQYCLHQLEVYTRLVDRLFEGYPEELKQNLLYSPVFRGFFNKEWDLRNREFIPFAIDITSRVMAVDCLGELHDEFWGMHGDAYLLDEYLFLNSVTRLVNDRYFMDRYCNLLRII